MADHHARSEPGRAQDKKSHKVQHDSPQFQKNPVRKVHELSIHASGMNTTIVQAPRQDTLSTDILPDVGERCEDSYLSPSPGTAVNGESDDTGQLSSDGTDNSQRDGSSIPYWNTKPASTQRSFPQAKPKLHMSKNHQPTGMGTREPASSHKPVSQFVNNGDADKGLAFGITAHSNILGKQLRNITDPGPPVSTSNRQPTPTCDTPRHNDWRRGNNDAAWDNSPSYQGSWASSESNESDSDTNNYILCSPGKTARRNDLQCSHSSHRR